jgi:porin
VVGDLGGDGVRTEALSHAEQRRPRIGILRASRQPADRNLIDRYANAGIEFIGLNDSRPDDKFGIAAGYARVSRRAQAPDADHRTFLDPAWPLRGFEGLLTAAYQYQIKDGWTLQYNLRHIIHPRGRCHQFFQCSARQGSS